MTTRTRPPATESEIDKNCRQIRAYYAAGQRSLRRLPADKIDKGAGAISEQAADLGWSPTKLYKARQFCTAYTTDDVDALCASIRDHQAHFGIGHLSVLVTVSGPRERAEVQRWAIKNDASKTELEAELKVRRGSLRQGGRRRRVVRDPAFVLVQIDEATDTWSRWYSVISEAHNGRRQHRRLLDALPSEVHSRLLSADRAMRRLREVVVQELEGLRTRRRRNRSR
jgi:hypothetical protein